MQGTLKVATANDLVDLVLILKGKGFLAVINGIEPEMDETLLEAEGKGNGGKLALFNLKERNFLPFTKLIMVATDDVVRNFY